LRVSSSEQARSLGPHVVGQRIVVRRLVRGETGPSGGPAMTDLLGTCVAWADGECVVSPDAGGPDVAIPLADIVSGKPVPPRPSPRLRVSPRDAQVRAFALFPDLVVEEVGGPSGWLLRTSATALARRANSVLAFPRDGGRTSYESSHLRHVSYDVVTVSEVEQYYASVGKPAVAAVLGESEEREFLRGLGWVPESHEADTLFQMASMASVRRILRSGGLSRVDVATGDTTATATVVEAGRVVGQGVAAHADGWVGFRGIEVAESHRRKGIGRAVMAALTQWGAELGATTAYLQVLSDNRSALALYASMGFQTHHAYAYLTPGVSVWRERGTLRSLGADTGGA
jgi:GNAT superfamily N-acetyltransferase